MVGVMDCRCRLSWAADTSIKGLRVARELDRVIARRGTPTSINVDNVPGVRRPGAR